MRLISAVHRVYAVDVSRVVAAVKARYRNGKVSNYTNQVDAERVVTVTNLDTLDRLSW